MAKTICSSGTFFIKRSGRAVLYFYFSKKVQNNESQVIYRKRNGSQCQFIKVNTRNATNSFDAVGELKVTKAVPEN